MDKAYGEWLWVSLPVWGIYIISLCALPCGTHFLAGTSFSFICVDLSPSRANPKRSHHLRYVLRNRVTGDIYLVVLFTLHLKEDVNEDGSLKPAAIASTHKAPGGLSAHSAEGNGMAADAVHSIEDEKKALAEAERQLGGDETNDDDID